MRASPQVHVSIDGQGKYVGQGSSWAAPTDEHRHGFDGTQVQRLGEAERREGHNAELGQQGDGHALGLQQVLLDLGHLHGAAQGNHGDEEDGDAEDVDGFVQGLGDAHGALAPVSSHRRRCCPVDLRHVHDGAPSRSFRVGRHLTSC